MIDKISISFMLFYLVLSHILRNNEKEDDNPEVVVISTSALLVKEVITSVTVNENGLIPEYTNTNAMNSTDFLLDDSLQNFSEHEINLRSSVTKKEWLWPRAVVPYAIDPHFDWWQHKKIGKAIKLFHQVSCVRFVPRTNQKDYILFQWKPDARCSSYVGKVGDGMQPIALKDECINNPLYKGLLVHEMMHALGFMHEHQRSDRDCYLHVSGPLSESIDFQIVTYTDTSFPYDYRSIMHYRRRDWFYAKNGEQIGNRAGTLTNMDKDKLNHLYCGAPHYCDLNPGNCRVADQAERACRAGTVKYNTYEEDD